MTIPSKNDPANTPPMTWGIRQAQPTRRLERLVLPLGDYGASRRTTVRNPLLHPAAEAASRALAWSGTLAARSFSFVRSPTLYGTPRANMAPAASRYLPLLSMPM